MHFAVLRHDLALWGERHAGVAQAMIIRTTLVHGTQMNPGTGTARQAGHVIRHQTRNRCGILLQPFRIAAHIAVLGGHNQLCPVLGGGQHPMFQLVQIGLAVTAAIELNQGNTCRRHTFILSDRLSTAGRGPFPRPDGTRHPPPGHRIERCWCGHR